MLVHLVTLFIIVALAFPLAGEEISSAAESITQKEVSRESPELWVPYLTWIRKGQKLTLLSVIHTPNSCFENAGHKLDFPEGKTGSPESLPVQMLIKRKKSDVCLEVVTPVYHAIGGLKTGQGKTTAIAFAIFHKEIRGTNSIEIPSLTSALSSGGDVPIPFIKNHQ
jgi:hypothetical protein